MDPIEILASILGHKSSGSGAGADVLKDIFTGGKQREASTSTRSAPTSRGSRSDDIDRQARELEDLLNVAKDRSSSRAGQPAGQAQRDLSPPSKRDLSPPGRTESSPTGTRDLSPPGKRDLSPPGKPDLSPPRTSTGSSSQPTERASQRRDDFGDADADRQNEQALVLVRAMVSAAKCDGEISRAEQQSILARLGDTSPDAIAFLREEFSKPLDVREFAWSVPIGMEQQVYTMSLIAIDLDTQHEAGYLRDLARGLRLSEETCDQIRDSMGLGGRQPQMASAR